MEWFPILSNIAPANLRRLNHMNNLLVKINNLLGLALFKNIKKDPSKKLKSRNFK